MTVLIPYTYTISFIMMLLQSSSHGYKAITAVAVHDLM